MQKEFVNHWFFFCSTLEESEVMAICSRAAEQMGVLRGEISYYFYPYYQYQAVGG